MQYLRFIKTNRLPHSQLALYKNIFDFVLKSLFFNSVSQINTGILGYGQVFGIAIHKSTYCAVCSGNGSGVVPFISIIIVQTLVLFIVLKFPKLVSDRDLDEWPLLDKDN